MSGDTLVYDMSLMSEGSPQIFVKRDYLDIQDQQSGNYAGNQVVIDTSQLANSNKYTDYRNAYLTVPMVMAISSQANANGESSLTTSDASPPAPGDGTMRGGATQSLSLKNWFGSIIHSMLLDYAGTTIIQNTPLCGLWNTFTLMTSLSMADVETLGPSIGFYPDSSNFTYQIANSADGRGLCNNRKTVAQGNLGKSVGGSEFSNPGIFERWSKMMIRDVAASGQTGAAYNTICDNTQMDNIYRSRVVRASQNPAGGDGVAASQQAYIVFQIQAIIYLRHIHSFFSQIPLLKGVFFRLTLNLNQPVVVISTGASGMGISSIVSPLGGVSPIMVAAQGNPQTSLFATVTDTVTPADVSTGVVTAQSSWGLNLGHTGSARITLNVGNTIIDTTQRTNAGSAATGLNQSCFLHVPMYTFNPSFESAYLSRPTKTIVYSDLYQYTTPVVTSGQFNFLITNGISNIKSVLVLPIEQYTDGSSFPPFMSPFDTCGGGSVAPLSGTAVTNFNVVVAGQNMVYNQVQRGYDEFNNQLLGVNAVNAGLVDGMTSGLISYWDYLQLYGYFYVSCARQLPIDEAVPKSVSIQGQMNTLKPLQFYVFIEYGVQVNVDVLTGARV